MTTTDNLPPLFRMCGTVLQGAVYVVRNDTSNGTTIYQLDTWHQATHPMNWPSGTVLFEASSIAPCCCIGATSL